MYTYIYIYIGVSQLPGLLLSHQNERRLRNFETFSTGICVEYSQTTYLSNSHVKIFHLYLSWLLRGMTDCFGLSGNSPAPETLLKQHVPSQIAPSACLRVSPHPYDGTDGRIPSILTPGLRKKMYLNLYTYTKQYVYAYVYIIIYIYTYTYS